jgi:hypothetical protein
MSDKDSLADNSKPYSKTSQIHKRHFLRLLISLQILTEL